MWWNLADTQREKWYAGKLHLPSTYNAALNNKSGWIMVAHAIIKYHMPRLPNLESSDGVTEHIHAIQSFCHNLLHWMKKFASASVIYWNSADYTKARATSQGSP